MEDSLIPWHNPILPHNNRGIHQLPGPEPILQDTQALYPPGYLGQYHSEYTHFSHHREHRRDQDRPGAQEAHQEARHPHHGMGEPHHQEHQDIHPQEEVLHLPDRDHRHTEVHHLHRMTSPSLITVPGPGR